MDNAYLNAILNAIPQFDAVYSVGSEVFVLGFPRGLRTQSNFPIWKRGTIATEPAIPRDDGAPLILIDAATRKGMSGSPVCVFRLEGGRSTDAILDVRNLPHR